jgi:hypothetical protein
MTMTTVPDYDLSGNCRVCVSQMAQGTVPGNSPAFISLYFLQYFDTHPGGMLVITLLSCTRQSAIHP